MTLHGAGTGITRREFGALTAGTLIAARPRVTAQGAGTDEAGRILDLADWSYHYYGVETVKLARGTMVNGSQMYVERWIPAQVRHPYPVVLVHGGYGQATDWLSTPDGRRGSSTSGPLQQGQASYHHTHCRSSSSSVKGRRSCRG